MTQPSQVDLWIAAAKKGDRIALAKLLALCDPKLRARAEARMDAALKSRFGLDDVLQEVYLHVFRQIAHFESSGLRPLLTWMYAILDHELIDLRRAALCQARDIDREVTVTAGADSSSYMNLLDHLYGISDTPSHIVRKQEALASMAECLAELSEPHRQVIELRFLEGLPVEAASARLGKSEAATVALTQRALKALRRLMDRRGEFNHHG
jgi:RNA polymerase sigma-70 factor (subfamily 1)